MGRLIRDRYKLTQQLSHKAGRQTWLALDQTFDQPVVLKMLRFGAEFSWDSLKLFEREAKTLQALEHPQIPKFLDFFEMDGGEQEFVLVQSYIEARSLTEHIQAGRSFTELELKQIAESILETLSYLHDRHPPVIHRDIKPSNILLTNRSGNHVGQVYLVDFGSVQTPVSKGSGTFTVVGTYGYMAPEQFMGRALPSSDLYGLGMTLAHVATGQHPADLMTDDLKLDVRGNASLSPPVAQWIERLIEPIVAQRFKSAAEALKALQSPPAVPVAVEADALTVTESILARYPLAPWNGMPWRRQLDHCLRIVVVLAFLVATTISILQVIPGNVLGFLLMEFICACAAYIMLCFLQELHLSGAWMQWGNELREAGKYQDALRKYDRVLASRPRSYLAWKNRGLSLRELKRHEEEIASYDKAIEIEPSSSYAWGERGYALNELGRYEEAIASYDRAIELKPDYDWAWHGKGYTLKHQSRYEQALVCFDKAIELNPSYSCAWDNRGRCLFELTRYEAALTSYEKALKLKPNSHWSWQGYGYVLRQQKRYGESIICYQRVRSLFPENRSNFTESFLLQVLSDLRQLCVDMHDLNEPGKAKAVEMIQESFKSFMAQINTP